MRATASNSYFPTWRWIPLGILLALFLLYVRAGRQAAPVFFCAGEGADVLAVPADVFARIEAHPRMFILNGGFRGYRRGDIGDWPGCSAWPGSQVLAGLWRSPLGPPLLRASADVLARLRGQRVLLGRAPEFSGRSRPIGLNVFATEEPGAAWDSAPHPAIFRTELDFKTGDVTFPLNDRWFGEATVAEGFAWWRRTGDATAELTWISVRGDVRREECAFDSARAVLSCARRGAADPVLAERLRDAAHRAEAGCREYWAGTADLSRQRSFCVHLEVWRALTDCPAAEADVSRFLASLDHYPLWRWRGGSVEDLRACPSLAGQAKVRRLLETLQRQSAMYP